MRIFVGVVMFSLLGGWALGVVLAKASLRYGPPPLRRTPRVGPSPLDRERRK